MDIDSVSARLRIFVSKNILYVTDADSRTRSITTASSVDEFFRSLMEIVPTTTKVRLNSNKDTKVIALKNLTFV